MAQRERTRRAVVFAPLRATAHAAHEALAERTGRRSSRAALILLTLLSLGVHGGAGLAIWQGRFTAPATHKVTRIRAEVRERPAPPAPPPKPEATPASPTAPPKLARNTTSTRPRTPVPAPTPPPPSAAPPAPVKVVGLSLESTSETGEGPAFAVGDTLAGATADTAAAPRPKNPDAVDAPPPAPVRGPNRVARGVAAAGSVLTPPRRIHEVKPRYPDALRAAGVEADVVLVVSLDATGKVLTVTVGKGSGDPLFDEAARTAALQERFSPALRDGAPVPTTFSFTTHFRLDTP